jgi:glucose/arabinose dehydrogenase
MKFFWIFSLIFVFCSPIHAETKLIKTEKILETEEVIWAFDFLPDASILFTEREGNLKIYNPKTKKTIKVSGLPEIHVSGQGGLLDVIIDSNFLKNETIYLSYSKKVNSGSTTALYKARLANNKLLDGKDIFVAKTDSSRSIHYGSRVRETKDGYLFLSVGDRGKRHEAQKLDNHHGKILRLTKDGKPAPNNPFLNNKKALDEIWSYGHRNPQGMDYDPKSDILYINEHGPRGGDEINKVVAGKNYGWPVITYGKEYWGPSIGEGSQKKGMEQPLYHFTPSIAPSGLIYYSGRMFPEWKENFFSGALKLTHLNRLYKKNSQWTEDRIPQIADLEERIRSVKEYVDGSIYFSTDSGKIIKITK